MEFFKKIWKWRVIIIGVGLGFWMWLSSIESEKIKAAEEAAIKSQIQEKNQKEDALFKSYNESKKKKKCGIKYEVTLETYGESVKVELRAGEIGNSFPLVIKEAAGGKLFYSELCEGKYFIAIGNDKDVSTTPIKEFSNGVSYTSTVTLTKGVGNMGSSRREKLYLISNVPQPSSLCELLTS